MPTVEIDAAGRRVQIRHDGDLTETVDAAVNAWRSTGDQPTTEPAAQEERAGSIGFAAALDIASAPTRADHDLEVTA